MVVGFDGCGMILVVPATSWIDRAIDPALPVSSASGWMWLAVLA
ncbi:MAG: hypothetical protein V2I56_05345 [Desulfobacteraceae bacterium]|jgi:hypothetical protein|nr:hypothetical protein [Desulfobacteraceae bacterium]